MMVLRRAVVCTVLIQQIKIEAIEIMAVHFVCKNAPAKQLHTKLVQKNKKKESNLCHDGNLKQDVSRHASGHEVSHG